MCPRNPLALDACTSDMAPDNPGVLAAIGQDLARAVDSVGQIYPSTPCDSRGRHGITHTGQHNFCYRACSGLFAPSNCVELRYRLRLWRHSGGERSKRFRDTGSRQPIAWHGTRTHFGRHTGKQHQTRSGYLGVDPRNDRWVIDFVPNARSSLSAELSECIGALVWHLLYFNDITKRVSSIGHQVPVTRIDRAQTSECASCSNTN